MAVEDASDDDEYAVPVPKPVFPDVDSTEEPVALV